MNRKQALKSMAAGSAAVVGLPSISKAFNLLPDALKGNINHSVCRWCYQDIKLEDLFEAGKKMGSNPSNFSAQKSGLLLTSMD